MSLFTLALVLAAASVVALGGAFCWLAARRRFERRTMSDAEAGLRATRPPVGSRGGARWVGGRARGAEWTAQIGNQDLLAMVRARRWHEAAPWLLLGAGVVGAFASWPFFVLQLLGLDGRVAGVVAILLLVVAVRTAWPRAETSRP
ncbi:MAG: hypothetical protein IT179_19845 [Acidobacteria bacterium]|nr:hypothetical protein [Acidobacteriota bacterium]